MYLNSLSEIETLLKYHFTFYTTVMVVYFDPVQKQTRKMLA